MYVALQNVCRPRECEVLSLCRSHPRAGVSLSFVSIRATVSIQNGSSQSVGLLRLCRSQMSVALQNVCCPRACVALSLCRS